MPQGFTQSRLLWFAIHAMAGRDTETDARPNRLPNAVAGVLRVVTRTALFTNQLPDGVNELTAGSQKPPSISLTGTMIADPKAVLLVANATTLLAGPVPVCCNCDAPARAAASAPVCISFTPE